MAVHTGTTLPTVSDKPRSEQAAAAARWALTVLAGQLGGGQALSLAVVHPLGFLCFPLHRGLDLGICVHVWIDGLPDVEVVTSPIHAHSWDLHSYVLFGQVGNELVSAVPAKYSDASHQVYEIDSAQGTDRIAATNSYVQCTRRSTHYASTGEEYTLSSGAFHSTAVSIADPSATVMIAHTIPGARDRSLGPPQPPGRKACWHVRRRLADPSLTRRVAETVVVLSSPVS
ncbi:MAG TPA: hypothetical protein VGS97_17130 [Actinocrinis sp.]|uniref:hypothetical protein n=1 Tax=Actinocrinis sp. TaxID=1920516 RepID=UPI002DDCD382|nr:hypothetical protein [Actinocrinis sp.]HEV2345825.1 hypothetical protein [Actinocrinis sp.]